MLTVPEQIKTLYKTDGVWKNFRAHFPDGERADITNSDIVRESLSFTESICSDNMLRFGGAERSSISFETVGVENILGLRIECGIEIDTTSLSAADLAAIEADPGDGILVAAGDSDIGRGYYRIPLGIFRVQSCPRDHRLKAHRQVTALSPSPWALAPVEAGKMNWWTGGKKYVVNALYFILANIGAYYPNIMEATGWVSTPVSLPTPVTGQYASLVRMVDADGNTVTLSYSATMRRYWIPWSAGVFDYRLGGLSLGDVDAAGIAEFVRTCCREVDIDFDASFPGTSAISKIEDTDTLLQLGLRNVIPSVYVYDPDTTWNYTRTVLEGDVPVLSGQTPIFDNIFRTPLEGRMQFQIPETIHLIFARQEGEPYVKEFTTGIDQVQPSAWKWTNTDAGPLASMQIELPIAGQVTGTGIDSQKVTWTQWSSPSKMRDLVAAYFELLGKMIYPGRTGMKEVRLNTSDPVAMTPGQFENVWWDDYDISPVGRVIYLYGKDHDKTGKVGVGPGQSVYDLTENALLAAVNMKPSEITAYVKSGLKQALRDLGGYSPAELDMPAWPWLEPGDCLRIQAEDGTIVTTYLLQRTMTGVQMLHDAIEAPGGEVVSDDE